MENKTRKRPTGRTLRNLLVAAVVVALLAISALASGWDAADQFEKYQRYENPELVLEAIFGENGIAYHEGSVTVEEGTVNTTVEHSFERVSLNADLASKYVEPYLYDVNESWEHRVVSNLDGFENVEKLTVVANLYDAGTRCGVLYYVLENNVGVDYQVCFDGSITGGDVLIYGYAEEYMDMAQTTENRLCVAVHYIVLGNEDYVQLKYLGGDVLSIPLVKREMHHITVGNGEVTISPIGMCVEESTAIGCDNMDCIDDVRIRFADGTEYVVFGALEGKDYDLNNLAYALGSGSNYQNVVYAFNRIVDVENIVSVIVNRVEYPVD